MTWNTKTGLYEYNNQNFYPIDGQGFGNYPYNNYARNYHFCLEYHTNFQYAGTETFQFVGDDDVFFFINNRLLVDLGGVHGAEKWGPNPLSNFATSLNIEVGGTYNFDFFYCERHTTQSTILFATNILLGSCDILDACGICNGPTTTDVCSGANKLQCNNGTCSCSTSSCICDPGWSNGPAGNCTRNCGNGILEPGEQCDLGPTRNGQPGFCCTSSCEFAPTTTSCSSGSTSNPCLTYTCSATGTCGVPKPAGSGCLPAGVTQAPQCNVYRCRADSVCELQPQTGTNCTVSGDLCSFDQCVNGACVTQSKIQCTDTACTFAGTCNATTGLCSPGAPKSNGLACGGSFLCSSNQCQNGVCTLVNFANNTPCGANSADGCSARTCQSGTCSTTPIASAQGSTANCPVSGNSCRSNVCSGTSCSTVNVRDNATCSSLGTSPHPQCTSDICRTDPNTGISSCTRVPINNGRDCSSAGTAPACQQTVCDNGQCVAVADVSVDGQLAPCSQINADADCSEFRCLSGQCIEVAKRERETCTTGPNPTDCLSAQCIDKICTGVPINARQTCSPGSEQNGCTTYTCSTNGQCVASFAPNTQDCTTSSNLCEDRSTCDGSGNCVSNPVECDATTLPGNCPGGVAKCDNTTGNCFIDADSCCGNGIVDGGEECDDASPCCDQSVCEFRPSGTECPASDPCQDGVCTENGQCVVYTPTSGVSAGQDCTPTLSVSIPECKRTACAAQGPKDSRVPGSTTAQDTTLSCQVVNEADGTDCIFSDSDLPECADSKCASGLCTIVGTASAQGQPCTFRGTVPECNTAICVGPVCSLSALNGVTCSGLPDNDCASEQCSNGQCVYVFTSFPDGTNCSSVTSPTECRSARCNGVGVCRLTANPGLACDRPVDPLCQSPQCDASGECTIIANNVDANCDSPRDSQCQVATCAANGVGCVVSNVTNGTPCTTGTAQQCQKSQCQLGQCVNVNLESSDTAPVCTPTETPNPCKNYRCGINNDCISSNVPDDTVCNNPSNLCSTRVCRAGTCVDNSTVVCRSPLRPCESPNGLCERSTGRCIYPGLGKYQACRPQNETANCPFSIEEPANYQCNSDQSDAVCAPTCDRGGFCGDGIVQVVKEECDFADPVSGGACCTTDCVYASNYTVCGNDTDPAVLEVRTNLSKSAGVSVRCYSSVCLRGNCQVAFLGTNVTGCAAKNRNNRTAILASVLTAGLTALVIFAIAGFLWRRSQKLAEKAWLQEFMDAGNARVENNAAFVSQNNEVASPIFSPSE